MNILAGALSWDAIKLLLILKNAELGGGGEGGGVDLLVFAPGPPPPPRPEELLDCDFRCKGMILFVDSLLWNEKLRLLCIPSFLL